MIYKILRIIIKLVRVIFNKLKNQKSTIKNKFSYLMKIRRMKIGPVMKTIEKIKIKNKKIIKKHKKQKITKIQQIIKIVIPTMYKVPR